MTRRSIFYTVDSMTRSRRSMFGQWCESMISATGLVRTINLSYRCRDSIASVMDSCLSSIEETIRTLATQCSQLFAEGQNFHRCQPSIQLYTLAAVISGNFQLILTQKFSFISLSYASCTYCLLPRFSDRSKAIFNLVFRARVSRTKRVD